jgi:hypothetical protein
MYYNQALQIADIDQGMASKTISMRMYSFKSFEYLLTIAATATSGNMAQELKPAGTAAADVKVRIITQVFEDFLT